jgi:cytochrome c peroxidase
MSVSTVSLKQRWTDTEGKDPVFAAIDGSNCPSLPQSAMGSHSLLLERGLFRIFLAWPPKDVKPDFRIEVVKDPTGCNTDPVYGMNGSERAISVYRRPRVAANLTYVSHLMADGRERSLESQATTAALGHEQATKTPTAEQLRQIAEFERQVFVAQTADVRGGLLNEADGPELLGPENIAKGRAGVTGGKALSFDPWTVPNERIYGLQKEFRVSAARGSALFSSRCATCHNEKAAPAWMDIGTTNRADLAELPLFKVICEGRAAPIYTSDPGRALITGKCADVGAIVTQQLRGLAARAPYFSNGSAGTLRDVVEYYDRRYQIGYSEREKQDLVNFLKVL